ncbi:MAG: hypothetical protein D6729_18475 [Deltaproteobacteria bacterium]|nr:MAG: hypothetical protein D6729_18475 [Deltaproteobacteria bacterium]
MCIARRHLDYLVARNEEDRAAGRIGYETHLRFEDLAERCRECPLLDNGRQGDMYEECRIRLLRYFVAARRDDSRVLRARSGWAAAE